MQNVHAMRPEVRADYDAALAVVDGDVSFGVRFERFFTELRDPLFALYGADPRFAGAWERLLRAVAAAAGARTDELRVLDHEREITPDWLQREQAVGYVTYVDRFAGTLAGLRAKLPYLRELGVTYLHLMPLLHARPAPNDGGYAVVDYGAVDPALGTMDDLRALASDLRAEGMALCVDLVLNHTAAEHPWVRRTRTTTGRSRTVVSQTRTSGRCRTSFRTPRRGASPRWRPLGLDDLQRLPVGPRLHEPGRVRGDVLGDARTWPRSGVDVLRLDAAPFLWKRVGTNCQNQPEVHELLQAFRAAMRIAAPAVAFKAEAIVAPRDLVPYLGTGRHEGKECDLAYHNVLMVLLWSALASGRVALMTSTLKAMPPVPPGAGWLTYVRCHDDIGWAITPEDAGRIGEDAYLHRRFLADFYAGEFPGTFARGARFQPDPRTGEARTSGTCASLAGLASAPDAVAVELAVRRILLLHAVAFAHGGLPLVYMGDELGLLNDMAYLDDPHKADDNRWMHRPLDGLGGRRAPPRPVVRRRAAVVRPPTPDRRPPRHPRDPRPGRHRAAVDRQRARLRPLPPAGGRDAPGRGELHRRPAADVTRGRALPRLRAERRAPPNPTAAASRPTTTSSCWRPYQHLWFYA